MLQRQGGVTWGLFAATTEVWVPRACAPWQEKPRQEEASTQSPEARPWSLQLKKALKAQEDPAQPKKKFFLIL